MDGSEAMVKHAKEKLGDRVNWSTFEDYKTNVLFDGIWACASLLHVPRQEMNKILVKYRDLLKPDGVYQLELKLILNI
jgi:trans-aconitate methyltransferase